MRHGNKVKKLGRNKSHRRALLANLAASLIIHKQIRTTEAKAKEARRLVERLISYGKKNTTHHRRLAFAVLRQKEVVQKLFDEVAPAYTDRVGGYTRIYKLGRRPNDAAKVVLLELVDLVGVSSAINKSKKESKPKADKTETPVASETAGE